MRATLYARVAPRCKPEIIYCIIDARRGIVGFSFFFLSFFFFFPAAARHRGNRNSASGPEDKVTGRPVFYPGTIRPLSRIFSNAIRDADLSRIRPNCPVYFGLGDSLNFSDKRDERERERGKRGSGKCDQIRFFFFFLMLSKKSFISVIVFIFIPHRGVSYSSLLSLTRLKMTRHLTCTRIQLLNKCSSCSPCIIKRSEFGIGEIWSFYLQSQDLPTYAAPKIVELFRRLTRIEAAI